MLKVIEVIVNLICDFGLIICLQELRNTLTNVVFNLLASTFIVLDEDYYVGGYFLHTFFKVSYVLGFLFVYQINLLLK